MLYNKDNKYRSGDSIIINQGQYNVYNPNTQTLTNDGWAIDYASQTNPLTPNTFYISNTTDIQNIELDSIKDSIIFLPDDHTIRLNGITYGQFDIIACTYQEFMQKRNNNALCLGQYYKITDYVACYDNLVYINNNLESVDDLFAPTIYIHNPALYGIDYYNGFMNTTNGVAEIKYYPDNLYGSRTGYIGYMHRLRDNITCFYDFYNITFNVDSLCTIKFLYYGRWLYYLLYRNRSKDEVGKYCYNVVYTNDGSDWNNSILRNHLVYFSTEISTDNLNTTLVLTSELGTLMDVNIVNVLIPESIGSMTTFNDNQSNCIIYTPINCGFNIFTQLATNATIKNSYFNIINGSIDGLRLDNSSVNYILSESKTARYVDIISSHHNTLVNVSNIRIFNTLYSNISNTSNVLLENSEYINLTDCDNIKCINVTNSSLEDSENILINPKSKSINLVDVTHCEIGGESEIIEIYNTNHINIGHNCQYIKLLNQINYSQRVNIGSSTSVVEINLPVQDLSIGSSNYSITIDHSINDINIVPNTNHVNIENDGSKFFQSVDLGGYKTIARRTDDKLICYVEADLIKTYE